MRQNNVNIEPTFAANPKAIRKEEENDFSHLVEQVVETLEQQFRAFKTRSFVATYHRELEIHEERLLQFLLTFGKSLDRFDLRPLNPCREKLLDMLIKHAAYTGSPRSSEWVAAFRELSSQHIRVNAQYDIFTVGTSKNGPKAYKRYEDYLGMLALHAWDARYWVYHQAHQSIIDLTMSLRDDMDNRSQRRSMYMLLAIDKRRHWFETPLLVGVGSPFDSAGASFQRLSDVHGVTEFICLARKMDQGQDENRHHSAATQLIRDSKVAFEWMQAVYECAHVIQEIQKFKKRPLSWEACSYRQKFPSPEAFRDRIFPRFQRAIELLDGLKDGCPFEWKFSLEMQMATCLVGQIAWLFRELNDVKMALHFENMYLERYSTYPDDEFAWKERDEMFSLTSHDSKLLLKMREESRESWDAKRRSEREQWKIRTAHLRRPKTPPPAASRPSKHRLDERREMTRLYLDSRIQNPHSTWSTRQEVIHSREDCYFFLEWLLQTKPPPDERRRKRFGELLNSTQEKGEVSRKICRAIVQIYHPDSNVKQEAEWQSVVEEIAKVTSTLFLAK